MAPMVRVDLDGRNVLSELDLTLTLADKPYKDAAGQMAGAAVGAGA